MATREDHPEQVFRVLLVDDTDLMRKLIKRFLRDEPVEVREAVNGSDALVKLAESKFDLVILDLSMPGMGGLEVAPHIRSNMRAKRLPILFCTADAQKDTVLEAAMLAPWTTS